jgi:uncharacterized protein
MISREWRDEGASLHRSRLPGRMARVSTEQARQPALVAAMLRPELYPERPSRVELRETHISWVFLTPEHAYKVKKPLKLPFLDYGGVNRRRRMCKEELRLNRRLAPDVYLDVVGVANPDGRWQLVSEDDPRAVEYAVRMRRIDESRSLEQLSRSGELTQALVERVARRVATFHAEAPVVGDPPAWIEALVATLEENHATLRAVGSSALGRSRLDAAEHFSGAFLAARRALLEARAAAGLVRDGHGDLRAEHVIVPEEGTPYVFDCIEFDPALRRIDVAADLAFLVMDLAALGEEELSAALVDAYRRAGGEPGDDATVSFFAAYRAWVRAKVEWVRAGELAGADPEWDRRDAGARKLFGLGERFAWRARRPLALVFCGVAASGKTTLAERVETISGWSRLSSDVIRKELAGLDPRERGRPEHYSDAFTAKTYRELGRRAGRELRRSGGVIVDATFRRRGGRIAFLSELDRRDAGLLFVECRAPAEVLAARADARQLHPDRVSDAGPEIVRRQLDEWEALSEISPGSRATVETTKHPDETVADTGAAADRAVFGNVG